MKNLCFAIPIFYTAGDGPMAKAYSSLCLLVRCREHPFTQPTSFGWKRFSSLCGEDCTSFLFSVVYSVVIRLSLFCFGLDSEKLYGTLCKLLNLDVLCLTKTKLIFSCLLITATALAVFCVFLLLLVVSFMN